MVGCIIILNFIFSDSLYSQVTIGNEDVPVEGALLQLKQDGTFTNNANATKGLGMPRVKLTDLNNISTDIPSAAGQENAHVGLTIYNVNEDLCAWEPIFKGLYTWDGLKWQRLGQPETNYMLFYDQEGNPFKARSFGNAGVWMTENLKATKFAGTTTGAQPVNNGGLSTSTAYFAYPNTITTEPTANNHEGLLYNWAAASNYSALIPGSPNQVQVNSITPGPSEVETIGPNGPDSKGERYLQGICPQGWHLPSDREWNELEKEIYTNADKYSVYKTSDLPFSGTAWQTSWETVAPSSDAVSPALRGSEPNGHGLAMLSQCPPSSITKGRSLPAIKGGFDVLPVGYVFDNDTSNSYGTISYMWSSSYSGSANTVISRSFVANNSKVRKIAFGRSTKSSVRCKQND